MLELIKGREHVAGMDAVDRAQVFLAAVRDRLRRLSSMRERKPAQRGQGIDEKDVELRQAHKLGV